jgi:hypothetical protein
MIFSSSWAGTVAPLLEEPAGSPVPLPYRRGR